jgi:HD superfamily phosphohydrolase YqeK
MIGVENGDNLPPIKFNLWRDKTMGYDFPDTEAQQAANDLACEEARKKAGLNELIDDIDCEIECLLYNNGCPLTNKTDTPKTKFINMLTSTNKKGMPEFITYLTSETDFFEAPASSNNHGNYKGGLLEHSLIVHENLIKLLSLFSIKVDQNTIIIVSLLHDLCKANFYKPDTRNVKNAAGQWEKVPYFSIDDETPLGHGEKSALILQQYVPLTMEEIMAIRWHMAGYDDAAKHYAGSLSLNNAMNKYSLIALLHMADLAAVNFRKKEVGGVL